MPRNVITSLTEYHGECVVMDSEVFSRKKLSLSLTSGLALGMAKHHVSPISNASFLINCAILPFPHQQHDDCRTTPTRPTSAQKRSANRHLVESAQTNSPSPSSIAHASHPTPRTHRLRRITRRPTPIPAISRSTSSSRAAIEKSGPKTAEDKGRVETEQSICLWLWTCDAVLTAAAVGNGSAGAGC